MQVYEVFARKDRGDPLRSIGSLNAPDDELARIYAFQTYDEERWFDMWIVPRDRFLEVFNADHGARVEGPVDGHAAGANAGAARAGA